MLLGFFSNPPGCSPAYRLTIAAMNANTPAGHSAATEQRHELLETVADVEDDRIDAGVDGGLTLSRQRPWPARVFQGIAKEFPIHEQFTDGAAIS
jgi:hypothetical protein